MKSAQQATAQQPSERAMKAADVIAIHYGANDGTRAPDVDQEVAAMAAIIDRHFPAYQELLEALSGLLAGLMMDYPTVAIGMNDWPPVVVARTALAKARAQ